MLAGFYTKNRFLKSGFRDLSGLYADDQVFMPTICLLALLQVPSEETVVEIRERYLELNWHSKSYTVKALVRTLEQPTFEFLVSVLACMIVSSCMQRSARL